AVAAEGTHHAVVSQKSAITTESKLLSAARPARPERTRLVLRRLSLDAGTRRGRARLRRRRSIVRAERHAQPLNKGRAVRVDVGPIPCGTGVVPPPPSAPQRRLKASRITRDPAGTSRVTVAGSRVATETHRPSVHARCYFTPGFFMVLLENVAAADVGLG